MGQVVDKDGAHAEFVELPGGSTGLLTKAYKRTEADQLAYRSAPGCSLSAGTQAPCGRGGAENHAVFWGTGRSILVTREPGWRG